MFNVQYAMKSQIKLNEVNRIAAMRASNVKNFQNKKKKTLKENFIAVNYACVTFKECGYCFCVKCLNIEHTNMQHEVEISHIQHLLVLTAFWGYDISTKVHRNNKWLGEITIRWIYFSSIVYCLPVKGLTHSWFVLSCVFSIIMTQ